jgi:DNA-binding XRE family transcriptional regulator
MTTFKELREGHHMSKAKLAREFGVTERTIYAWEKGDPVKPLVVLAYAELFDTSPDDIDALIARYTHDQPGQLRLHLGAAA